MPRALSPFEVLMLHRHLRHDQVVTGLAAALEARKHDEVSDDPGTEPRAEPTEPPGRQAVRSLTERRLRAQLPADDRPLPTVDKYDQRLTSHRENPNQGAAP